MLINKHTDNKKRGLSLLEVLMAAIIASLAIIPYFGLNSSETRSTRALAQRAKALSLAQNTLNLFTHGHRKALYNSKKNSDGTYEIKDLDLLFANSTLATGMGLKKWIGAHRKKGYFLYSVLWVPNPPDLSGTSTKNSFGKLSCKIGWLDDKKRQKHLTLQKVITR